jgi:hypothetical protein
VRKATRNAPKPSENTTTGHAFKPFSAYVEADGKRRPAAAQKAGGHTPRFSSGASRLRVSVPGADRLAVLPPDADEAEGFKDRRGIEGSGGLRDSRSKLKLAS